MHESSRRTRALVFRLALAALAVGAAVFVSPVLASQALAADGEASCSATCMRGSCFKTGDSCTCTCTWFTGEAVCKCNGEVRGTPIP